MWRTTWKRVGISLLSVPVLALAGIGAIALVVVTSRTLMRGAGLMELDTAIGAVWDWLRVPVALALFMLILTAVYRFAADDHKPFSGLLPGAAVAAALWALASVALPVALSTVLNYGVTYGRFSAAIVMLVYLYVLAAAVLLGAEVNATLEMERGASRTRRQ